MSKLFQFHRFVKAFIYFTKLVNLTFIRDIYVKAVQNYFLFLSYLIKSVLHLTYLSSGNILLQSTHLTPPAGGTENETWK